jgi:hypothetical protein
VADADEASSRAPRWRPDGQQPDADLLADGRRLLEKLCRGFRVRHLYPAGANLALLFEAFQILDRERTVGRVAPRTRPQRRRLRKLVRELLARDIAVRSLRLTYKLPNLRPRRCCTPRPRASSTRALGKVDADVRPDVRHHIHGTAKPALKAAHTPDQQQRSFDARFARGLAQLRDALINEALAHPDELPALHPQYLSLLHRRPADQGQHPLARLLFVKLPVYLWLGFFGLFSVIYVGAYFFLNDENLGRLLTMVIGRQINGDLELGSVHWGPTLILDMVTGTPHHASVKNVKIWRGYKRQGGQREHLIGWADSVEAKIMLHEIIPWNRIGIVPRRVRGPVDPALHRGRGHQQAAHRRRRVRGQPTTRAASRWGDQPARHLLVQPRDRQLRPVDPRDQLPHGQDPRPRRRPRPRLPPRQRLADRAPPGRRHLRPVLRGPPPQAPAAAEKSRWCSTSPRPPTPAS